MSIIGLKVTATSSSARLSWGVGSKFGNAIVVKWRTSPLTSWRDAPRLELPPSATSCLVATESGVRYRFQVSQVQFATPAEVEVVTPRLRRFAVDAASIAQWLGGGSATRAVLAAGASWDRPDVGDGSDLTAVRRTLDAGFQPLVLYNPGTGRSGGLNNRTDVEVGIEVKSLVQRLLVGFPGVLDVVVGNEPWFNGDTAASYAAKFAAAKATCAGLGVRLAAMTTGDYYNGTSWSKDGADGGWTRDFLRALGSASFPDAWSVQPYPVGGVVTANNHEHSGWPAVADWRAAAVALGSAAPWWVTEIGLRRSDFGDEAARAAALTRLLDSLVKADPEIPGTPYDFVDYFAWYQIADDSSGNWGLFNADATPRPVFDALAAWLAAH